MLIDSDYIKTAKKHLEVMQAFIDGKEIEYKKKFSYDFDFGQCTTPTWDFDNYAYRIKPSEPEYIYPIYKRLKKNQETIIKFTSIDAGIYISTHKNSIYKKYEEATALIPHTEEDWEDCNESINVNTEELFEVIYYCEIMKEFEFVKQLYLDEDLVDKEHLQKTGRSFIIDKDTNKIIKVVN